MEVSAFQNQLSPLVLPCHSFFSFLFYMTSTHQLTDTIQCSLCLQPSTRHRGRIENKDTVSILEEVIVRKRRDFPGSPVAKTPSFQYRGCGFDPWLRNQDPTCHVVQSKNKIKKLKRKKKIDYHIYSIPYITFSTKFYSLKQCQEFFIQLPLFSNTTFSRPRGKLKFPNKFISIHECRKQVLALDI